MVVEVRQAFRYWEATKKYGEFNIEKDKGMSLSELKEKYLVLKSCDDYVAQALHDQTLDGIDDIEKLMFFAVEFPDYFKLPQKYEELAKDVTSFKEAIRDGHLANIAAISRKINQSQVDEPIKNKLVKRAIAFAIENKNLNVALQIATEFDLLNDLVYRNMSILSVLSSRPECSSLIKENISLFDLQNQNNQLALQQAVRYQNDEIVYFLLNNNIRVNMTHFFNESGSLRFPIYNDYDVIIYDKWKTQEVVRLQKNFETLSLKKYEEEHRQKQDRTRIASANNTPLTYSDSLPDDSLLSQVDDSPLVITPTDASPSVKRAIRTGKVDIDDALIQENFYEKVRFAHAPVDKRDNESGDSPLHKAVKLNQLDLITDFLNLGADIFLTNRAGLSPLEIAIHEGHQEAFDLLLNSVVSLDEQRMLTWHYTNADKILKLITTYLNKYPQQDYRKINFMWNYLVKPYVEHFASAREKWLLTYCFKETYIRLSKQKLEIENLPDEHVKLSKRIKELVALYNEKTMLSLNTCRHWYSISLGSSFRPSVLHQKLEHIVLRVKNVLRVELDKVHGECDQLSDHFKNFALYAELKNLVEDLDKVSAQRSIEYGASHYIAQAFPSMRRV